MVLPSNHPTFDHFSIGTWKRLRYADALFMSPPDWGNRSNLGPTRWQFPTRSGIILCLEMRVTPQNHRTWRYLRENRSDASGMWGFYQHLPTVLGLNMGKATRWTTRFPGVTDTATSRRDRKVHFLNGRCSGSVRVDLSSGGSGMLRILWRKLEIKPSKYPWKWTKVLNFWELLEKDQIKSQN